MMMELEMAKFELVLTIPWVPIGAKGEPERGGSAGTSFHGSLGLKVALVDDKGVGLPPKAGAKVEALALRLLGGDVADEPSAAADGEGIDRASLPKLDMVRCMIGVVAPEPGGGMMGD
jgi:hypothetical protein